MDFENFYDSVSPLLVMEEMVAFGFDPVLMPLSMQIHLPPRVLRRDGHNSLPIASTSSGRNCLVALLEEVRN